MNDIVLSIGGILLITIMVLIVLNLVKHDKENFTKCVCSSRYGAQRDCQDDDEVRKLYDENKLTEYTDLVHPGWAKVSPGDIDYPLSEGCKWCDSHPKNRVWSSWDFTDFGN